MLKKGLIFVAEEEHFKCKKSKLLTLNFCHTTKNATNFAFFLSHLPFMQRKKEKRERILLCA